MGLFGGGAQKRRIEELEAEVLAARAETDAVRRAKAEAEARAAEKDKAVQAAERRAEEAAEALRKAKAKTDKTVAVKGEQERRESALKARVEHLEAESAEYRHAMLEARRDAESAHAARFDLQRELDALKARPVERVVERVEVSPVITPVAPPPRRERNDDGRLERLEEQLNSLKAARDELRDKLVNAEKQASSADRKLKSELGKADAVLRDLRHNLGAERKAYRILQLQFEAIVDRTRGLDQLVEAKVADIIAARGEAPAAAAEPMAPVALHTPIATVLPDAPPLGEGEG
jgi:DNA repair exonuclease SbcCD ATPase subunit